MDEQTATMVLKWMGAACGLALAVDVVLLAIWAAHLLWRCAWPFARRWSVADVFVAAQIGLAALLMASAVIIAVYIAIVGLHPAMEAFADVQSHLGLVGVLTLAQAALMLAVPLLYFARYRIRLRELGVSLRHLKRGVLLGIGWFVPVFIVTKLLELVSKLLNEAVLPKDLLERLQGVQEPASAARFLGKMPAATLIVVFVVAAMIVPFVEEVCFRGFLYNSLRMRWGIRWGIAISAVLFASAHLPVLAILPYLFLSVMLASCYEKTGTLIAPMTIHCLNNGLLVVLAGLGLVEP